MILSLAILALYVTTVEYVAHRWFMHRRGAMRYQPHHVMHHCRGDNSDEYMDFDVRTASVFYLASAPLVGLLSFTLTPWVWAPWTAFCAWWFFAWKATHRLIHGDERYWWARVVVPYYPMVKRHHEGHHQRMTRNYGALFLWSDRLFGTAI